MPFKLPIPRPMNWKKKISLRSLALIILFTLIAIKLTDYALLRFLPDQEYLFPPNSRARYKTIEFDVVVSINRFGFRGNETEITEGQILVIGDSFTFGFGLRDDHVWARLLEGKLKSSGLDLKVYNLGVPGTDSSFHLEVADKYIRRLKPKFVVISVLVGDDFQQVLEKYGEQAPKKSTQGVLKTRADNSTPSYFRIYFDSTKSYLKDLFPSLHEFYTHARGLKSISRLLFPGLYRFYVQARTYRSISTVEPTVSTVTQSWGEDARKIVREKNLFLPDDVLKHARAGDINPGLFSLASEFPSRGHQFWDGVERPGSSESYVLAEMTNKFLQISSLAKEFGGSLFIFSMPDGESVNSKVTKNYRKYGFKISESNLVDYKSEIILAKMAKNCGAIFIPSLTDFRQHRGAELFFPLDGHLTPDGSELVANILSNALLNQAHTH